MDELQTGLEFAKSIESHLVCCGSDNSNGKGEKEGKATC